MKRPNAWLLLLLSTCVLLCAGCQQAASGNATPGGWYQTGTDPANDHFFEVGVDRSATFDGKASAYITGAAETPYTAIGSLAQAVRADVYRGKRVRLSGYLKTEKVGTASLWANAAGQHQGHLALLNYQERFDPSTTQDWSEVRLMLDVPPTADVLRFGIALGGSGRLWFDQLKIEIVPTPDEELRFSTPELWPAEVEERITAQLRKMPPLEEPRNLGFEG